MWLAQLFYHLEDIFYAVEYKFWYVAYWLEQNTGWSGLANLFYDIADFFNAAWRKCRDIGREIENWWATISQTVSDLSSLWNHVYGWITDKVNEAINAASTALSRANQAINNAAAAFQKAIDEAAAALAAAKAYAETLIPDVAAWVTSHAVDIYTAIKGYLADIAVWVQTHSLDVWQAVKDHLVVAIGISLSSIAAPVNLVNTWFDAIQDFFNDPWDWLEAKFEAWFERNW